MEEGMAGIMEEGRWGIMVERSRGGMGKRKVRVKAGRTMLIGLNDLEKGECPD